MNPLPHDPLETVLSFLEPRDLAACARVNQHWYDSFCSGSVWQRKCDEAGLPDNARSSLPERELKAFYERYAVHRFCASTVHPDLELDPAGRQRRLAFRHVGRQPSLGGDTSSMPQLLNAHMQYAAGVLDVAVPEDGELCVAAVYSHALHDPNGVAGFAIGVADSTYQVLSHSASGGAGSGGGVVCGGSQGFWSACRGVGLYGSGGLFALGDCLTLGTERFRSGDCVAMHVHRRSGRVCFFRNGVCVARLAHPAVQGGAERVVLVLQRRDAQLRLVAPGRAVLHCAGAPLRQTCTAGIDSMEG